MRCGACGFWESAPLSTSHDDYSVMWLSDVKAADDDRLVTGPWDKVWGGGMVKTSVTLLGGAPGAGKSTLLLQIVEACGVHWNDPKNAPLYIAAEEAISEIRLRANRLKLPLRKSSADAIGKKTDVAMVPALNGASVGAILERMQPCLIIIDSLQGLVGKDDEAQEKVCKIAKEHSVRLQAPTIIISHVTKDEVLSGQNTLQHAVDVTMLLYPSSDSRVLMATKNRFGPAFKEVAFEMTEEGLVYLPEELGDE